MCVSAWGSFFNEISITFVLSFCILSPQTHNPQTHNPTPTNIKKMAWRRELTESKASAASAHSAGPVPSSGSRALRASNFKFVFRFPVHVFLSPKPSKFRIPPNPPKISKIGSRNFLGFDFDRFRYPFHQFSQYFMTRRISFFFFLQHV